MVRNRHNVWLWETAKYWKWVQLASTPEAQSFVEIRYDNKHLLTPWHLLNIMYTYTVCDQVMLVTLLQFILLTISLKM